MTRQGINRFALGPLLAFDTPAAVYNRYGRVYDVVFLLFLPAAFALHDAHRRAGDRLEKLGFGLLVLGLIATFIGVAGDYCLGGAGFIIEMPGLLILAIGASTYGIATADAAPSPQPAETTTLDPRQP